MEVRTKKVSLPYIKLRHRLFLWMFRGRSVADIKADKEVVILYYKYAFGKMYILCEETVELV